MFEENSFISRVTLKLMTKGSGNAKSKNKLFSIGVPQGYRWRYTKSTIQLLNSQDFSYIFNIEASRRTKVWNTEEASEELNYKNLVQNEIGQMIWLCGASPNVYDRGTTFGFWSGIDDVHVLATLVSSSVEGDKKMDDHFGIGCDLLEGFRFL